MGIEGADDAGVYQLTEEIALVQTIDFFTPIVDDPYMFGQIAAANALSDVYAMGGRPLTAMNVVCFPAGQMPISVLQEVLRGGLAKLREAAVALVGGHSVEDPELKYGLAVTGLVHPRRVITNRGARAGDLLVLTKPLGTGVIATALKGGMAEQGVAQEAMAWMAALNREAAEAMVELGAHACTDVTGFGLLGHACEMVEGGPVGMVIRASAVPLLPGAEQLASMGLVPAGTHRNRQFRQGMVEVDPRVPPVLVDLLFDPQTSGGLLVSLPAEGAHRLVERLRGAAIVGQVTADRPGRVVVAP